MATEVVGRGEELEALGSFLETTRAETAVLAIEGDPGIGKTTIWQAGVRLAREQAFTVLVARGTESDAGLSFVALADLFDPVNEALLTRLPPPQRDAFASALLRQTAPEAGVDERALFAAVLSLLRMEAAQGPLLVAVDDAQWIDGPSARAVSFALRRLTVEPVGFLVAIRTTGGPAQSFDQTADPARRRTLPVGPMSVAALHELIKRRTGCSLARPVTVRIAESCAGNPFYALEMAAGLSGAARPADGHLPVPRTLRELLESRIGRLPGPTREALLRSAMLARPTPETVEVDALEPAERAGVVVIEQGRIRFSHPLLASALYDQSDGSERRRVHRQLADVVADPEERARHLALSSPRADPRVAAELEAAASSSAARGAPQTAAELAELAVGLTPPDRIEDRARRRSVAGHHWADAGDLGRAQVLLEEAISSQPAGDGRARSLATLAQLHFRRNSFSEAIEVVRQAHEEAVDVDLRIRLDLDIAFFSVSLADFPGLERHARAAADALPDDADPALRAEVLAVLTIAEFLCGRGLDEPRLARALELEDRSTATAWQMRPSFIAACLYLYTGRPATAVETLSTLHTYAVERGEESVIPLHCLYLTWALVGCGDLRRAKEVAGLAGDTATLVGDPASLGAALTARALVHALDGSEDLAGEEALQAIRIFQELNWPSGTIFPSWALGLAATTAGRPEAVDAALGPLAGMVVAIGIMDPGLAMFVPDQIEALIELGRLEEADVLLGWFEGQGRRLDRAATLGPAGRCRALHEAARGDMDGALRAAEEAVSQHDRIDLPFERARTLLAWGRILRRSGRRAEAGQVLNEAVTAFAALGMPVWAERAHAELDRLGGRRTKGDELTPTESVVAGLAASGLSNREIAERAFLTVKAVEANLTRVYRKLDIRSRGGLARALQRSGRLEL